MGTREREKMLGADLEETKGSRFSDRSGPGQGPHTGPGKWAEHGSALAPDSLCAWADEPELRVLFYGLQRQWWCQACLWSQLWAGKVVASVQGHHGATAKKVGAEMELQPG